MKDHVVVKKILPEYFSEVKTYRKNFELRKDEDDIQVGDVLVLREYNDGEYTDRAVARRVTYVLRNCEEYGLMKGYCIIGFQPVDLEMIDIDAYR